MARKLKIRDLTLRDGHQSLFATRLQSKHVEQVIEDYCQTLTEDEFKTFCHLSEARQSTIAQKWRIEKYAQERIYQYVQKNLD